MKGVHQKSKTECVRACVASVFEVNLEDIPEFDPVNWDDELREWLSPMGLTTVNMSFADVPYDPTIPRGYTLGAVPTDNPDSPSHWKHCVVCLDGVVVWCPKRGVRPGTQRAEEYTVIYPLSAHRYKFRRRK